MLAVFNLVPGNVSAQRRERLWLNVSKLRKPRPRLSTHTLQPVQVRTFVLVQKNNSPAEEPQAEALIVHTHRCKPVQKNNSPAECRILCSPVSLGPELLMDDSAMDTVEPSDMQECTASLKAAESPSLEYSHFISLPLANYPTLIMQVNRFHDSVMALNSARSNDEAKESSNMSLEKVENDNVETSSFGMMEKGRADTEMLLDEDYEQSKEEYTHCDTQEIMTEDGLPSSPLRNGLGIEKSILIKPETLHLTVLMLKLWSDERVAAAIEVLQGLNSKLLDALNHQPVAVRLKGVECMKGSPAKAHVLYARVEDAEQENRLLCACEVIRDTFIEAGLVSEKDKKQELKLHATLINSSYRKRKRAKRFRKRMPFDARPILSKHGSEYWGEYTIKEAHLSQRFVFGDDGYYRCCGSLKFPPARVL